MGAEVLAGRDVVLFDYDGTLANTVGPILACFEQTLAQWGFSPEEMGDLRRMVGPPLPYSFCDVYGMSCEEAEDITRVYRANFAQIGLDEFPLFEGVPQLLDDLLAAGRRLAVATSRLEERTLVMLGHQGILDRFEVVMGQLPEGRAAKAEVINDVLDALACDRSRVVMVGDRSFDVEGAAAFGLPCVGVTYADTGGVDELRQAGAAAIAPSVSDLGRILLGAGDTAADVWVEGD